jgi:hypothetical protein
MTYVTPGTKLTIERSGLTNGHYQVSFIDSGGRVLGKATNQGSGAEQQLFVSATDVTCISAQQQTAPIAADTRTPATEQQAAPQTQTQNQPAAGAAKPAATPTGANRMKCKTTIPTHVTIVLGRLWAKADCTSNNGNVIKLDLGAFVEVEKEPTKGSPKRYYNVQDQCFLPADNLDLGSCKPSITSP